MPTPEGGKGCGAVSLSLLFPITKSLGSARVCSLRAAPSMHRVLTCSAVPLDPSSALQTYCPTTGFSHLNIHLAGVGAEGDKGLKSRGVCRMGLSSHQAADPVGGSNTPSNLLSDADLVLLTVVCRGQNPTQPHIHNLRAGSTFMLASVQCF